MIHSHPEMFETGGSVNDKEATNRPAFVLQPLLEDREVTVAIPLQRPEQPTPVATEVKVSRYQASRTGHSAIFGGGFKRGSR
jgi:hypothetical protein